MPWAWLAAAVMWGGSGGLAGAAEVTGPPVVLPAPQPSGGVSVEQALHDRRSVRAFAPTALALPELAQLLWAAQGVTDSSGHRTAPSAGALRPLEVFAVVGQVSGLPAGIYRYLPASHALQPVQAGNRRERIAAATRGQAWVAQAPVVLLIAGDPARSRPRYGERAERYLQIEAGAVAQNVYLQCSARGWGTVLVGAFDDEALREALHLPGGWLMLAMMPVGHRR